MRHNRAMTGRFLWPRAALVLLGALMLTGCASAVVVRVPKAGPETACVTPAPDREVLVGVALSGGGSRAALFGAAGLEALGRLPAPGGGSVLEQVAYLSSVSGGSVAAASYASQKPPRETPVLTPEGALTAEYETFFAEYHEKLRQDFEGALLRRQLLAFRWLNSSLAARSLAEVMAERLLGHTTFARAGPAGGAWGQPTADHQHHPVQQRPALRAHHAAARRLPVRLLCGPARLDDPAGADGGVPARLLAALGEAPHPHPAGARHRSRAPSAWRAPWRRRRPFPPLVGPITFRVGEEDLYWHTGDGGLYENQGFESLLFVFLKKLQDKTARRALILAFDSSFPFDVGERRLTRRSQPFSLWNYDYTRIPSIMEQRASTYQALFLRSMQLEGVFPDDQTIRVVTCATPMPTWQPDLSDLPDACRRDNPALDSPTAVVERIAEISTRFWLASACDRQLLQVAAAKVVAQRQAGDRCLPAGPRGEPGGAVRSAG